jgi:zinc protease
MRYVWSILVTCVFILNTAHATPFTVQEYTLNNGMKVLVKPDHRAPVIAVYTGYKIGGSYEPSGITGISHALEHMMFQGTYTHPAGEFFKIIQQNGGAINASTGSDYTIYEINISKDKLPLAFELEADRMQHLLLDEKAFKKEIEVVKEERRMRTDNDPRAYTRERFNAAAFPGNPYQNPVVGWRSDLDNMTVDDLRQWYQTWYAPNNAFVTVVGDVNPDEVFQLAQTYFGALKPSPLPTNKPFSTVPSVGERYLVVKRPAKLPYLMMGYNIPTIPSHQDAAAWEPYALDVLASLLDGGDSARFAKQLIREQKIASSVSASADTYDRLPSLFVITGTPSSTNTIKQLQQAIQQQFQDLQTSQVSANELDRVKAQILADKTYQQDSLSDQAYLIGVFNGVGLGWQEYNHYVEQVNAITPAQVQHVAQKYFVPERLTVAVLEPQPLTGDQ